VLNDLHICLLNGPNLLHPIKDLNQNQVQSTHYQKKHTMLTQQTFEHLQFSYISQMEPKTLQEKQSI